MRLQEMLPRLFALQPLLAICVPLIWVVLTPLLLQVLRLLNVDPGVGLSDAEVVEVGTYLVSRALACCSRGSQAVLLNTGTCEVWKQ